MSVSIASVMRHIRNYFERGYRKGSFEIIGNMLSPECDAPMVAVSGSQYHDGVYSVANGTLVMDKLVPDEQFEGIVWMLYPPDAFMELCRSISDYSDANPVGAMRSESFGDYSYTRNADSQGRVIGWESAYSAQLAAYRKMYTDVVI